MVDILHRVGVKGQTPRSVYTALSSIDGLSGWWTEKTAGSADLDGVIEFRFEGDGGADMRVIKLDPDRLVVWEVIAGPAEWIGTTIRFDLRETEGYTIVLFAHAGWREPVEFMHHCTTKWAQFLMSLKHLLETGTGSPYPHDEPLGDWS